MKLTITKLFIILIFIAVFSLIVLGSLAIFFNGQLAKNQKFLAHLTSVENSRFLMSNALANFLAKESISLTQSSSQGISELPSTLPSEKAFEEGLSNLAEATGFNPELNESLEKIRHFYSEFIIYDHQVTTLKTTILEINEALKLKTDATTKAIINVIDKSEKIEGVINLQRARYIRKIHSLIDLKTTLDTSDEKQQMLSAVQKVIERSTSEAERLTQKMNTDFSALINFITQINQESNIDALRTLRGNQINQLIELINRGLNELKTDLKTFPDLLAIVIEMEQDFRKISSDLLENPKNIYDLRLFNIQNEQKLQTAILKIQGNLIDIDEQFDILDKIANKLRSDLIKESNDLYYKNRFSVIMTVSIFLILMTVAGYFIQKFLSKSLQLLTRAMKKISQEKGGLKSRLESTRFADLNQVTLAFNKMASELDYTQANLEDLVASKTRELENLVIAFRKARDEADQANKIKSEFMANMSHELRTPLNAIIGYSEMLMEETADTGSETSQKDLKRILNSAKDLLGMINDLLDMAKIESGKIDVYLEFINIPDLVRDVESVAQPLIEKKHNTYHSTLSPDLHEAYTDAVKIKQCLLNLISNASKFTEDGTIILDVKPVFKNKRDWIEFSVSDTGIGLAPDKLEKLFKSFSQADASTTRKYGGTGLGLFLTRQFCTLLGGTVTVESEEGKGSTFTMTLPLISQLPKPNDQC